MTSGLPPGPRSRPIVGNLVAFRRDPCGFLARNSAQYGDVWHFHFADRRVWFFAHPDAVEALLVRNAEHALKDPVVRQLAWVLGDGLLTAEGETWRRHRRMAAPSFTPRQIASYAGEMTEIADQHALRWTGVVDLHRACTELTREVVLRTVFGTRAAVDAVDAIDVLMDAFILEVRSFRRFLPAWVPTRTRRRIRLARAALDRDVFRILADRRAHPAGDDLLSRLLAARDDGSARAFDNRELRDEMVTLYSAGHETTALTLTYACWLLARHPEVLARARAEVGRLGGPAGAGDLPKLKWIAAVIDEALRLYPPAWGFGRELSAGAEVAGWSLPPGAQILVSPWVLHHDARWWPEPDRFLPERWLTPAERPRMAYLPFGAGPRTCIGQHFARMEAILLLAAILRRVTLLPADDAPLAVYPSITLRPTSPVRVRVEKSEA